MPYIDSVTRTPTPTSNEQGKPLGRLGILHGLYMGFIKDASDVQRNGRLRVWIPELGSTPDEEFGWITVNYCSPFAGATNVNTTSTNTSQFDGTQTSYGMWMIPPDIDNIVLVMFINGDSSNGVWIGCLYNQFMNQMVPGMPATTNNYQYQGKPVPVAEYNKRDTAITAPESATRPVETTKFKGLGNQGLLTDQGRGITNTGARREAPSAVFGILTPGPAIDKTAAPENIRRKGGSAFIMDDGTDTEYIQLVTKTGAQIRIDESNGYVYLINRDGTAWIQMDQKGNVDIFGATNVSMRAQQDINLRADRNINIEAGQSIYMKAAKDTATSTTTFTYDVNNVPKEKSIPFYNYVGEGQGVGGNIVMQALGSIHTTVEQDIFTTVKRDINFKITRDYLVTVGQDNAILVTRDFNVTTTGAQNLKATGAINMEAASINEKTPALNIEAAVSITGDVNTSAGVGITGMLNVAGGAVIGASVSLGSPGTVGTITAAGTATAATEAAKAEVKPLAEKINILPTFKDPESKFKRNSEALSTTVSTLPTFEPCPEHEQFSLASITGYTPTETEGLKTYRGSGGAGNDTGQNPAPNTTPGANNTLLPPLSPLDTVVTRGINVLALKCQLITHEGYERKSYPDLVLVGGICGGVAHLMRTDEKLKYPIGTSISDEQINKWLDEDIVIAVTGAQRLLSVDVWSNLSDIRKRACADLVYNMGLGTLMKFVRFIAAMKSYNYQAAGVSLRDSKWFTQVGRRGPNIIAMIVQDVDPNGCDKKFPAT